MDMTFQLSDRLQAILNMIPVSGVLCDVGCDHGYLSIEAVNRGVCKSAYALDVRKGPLSRAEEHIAEAGLNDVITTILSDGLDNMPPDTADVIVIAGMGGPLMEGILTRGADKAKKADCLILSPQSHVRDFREFLCRGGYHIIDEDMVFDEGKYYFIIKVRYESGEHMVLDEKQLRYGTKDSPVLNDFMKEEYKRFIAIRENLLASKADENRLKEIENEIAIIEPFC